MSLENGGWCFVMEQKVLFKHCDPAGIVFYPRYFEMINDCVEMFFCDALGRPFESMLPEFGVPLVSISAQFLAPSRFGDLLQLALSVSGIGRTSMQFAIRASCGTQTRFETGGTIVYVAASGVPHPWPPDLRDCIEAHCERRS